MLCDLLLTVAVPTCILKVYIYIYVCILDSAISDGVKKRKHYDATEKGKTDGWMGLRL